MVISAALAAIVLSACGGNKSSLREVPEAKPAATRASDGLPGTEVPSNGNEIVRDGQSHGRYFTNPPTSGWHVRDVPKPGIYEATLKSEEIPGFLEVGGVWVLYNCPSGCAELLNQVIPVVNQATEKNKPVALAPYDLMDKKLALVAWQRILTLPDFDQTKVQEFIDKLTCRYNPDGVAPCAKAGAKTAAREAPGGFTGMRPTPAPTPPPSQQWPAAPEKAIDENKTYTATISTDKGDIIVELNPKAAPITVNNFVFLARQHFYDGVTFHRVLAGFVAQAGDPTGTGSGGPGYSIPDEKSGLKHDEGVIAMAKSSAPNSAGSQFYITLAPQPALDANYTVFGKVVKGLDVAKKITLRDPSQGGNLPPGDKILTVTIEEK